MSVPAPPPRDRRQTRYPLSLIVEARELAEAGWTPTQIRRFFEQSHGVRPALSSVRGWVDEGWRESQVRWNRRSYERRTRGVAVTPLRAPRSEAEARMIELRNTHGLSYQAISVVLRVYHGVEWGPEKVRYICTRHLGAEKNPRKARSTSRRNELRLAA